MEYFFDYTGQQLLDMARGRYLQLVDYKIPVESVRNNVVNLLQYTIHYQQLFMDFEAAVIILMKRDSAFPKSYKLLKNIDTEYTVNYVLDTAHTLIANCVSEAFYSKVFEDLTLNYVSVLLKDNFKFRKNSTSDFLELLDYKSMSDEHLYKLLKDCIGILNERILKFDELCSDFEKSHQIKLDDNSPCLAGFLDIARDLLNLKAVSFILYQRWIHHPENEKFVITIEPSFLENIAFAALRAEVYVLNIIHALFFYNTISVNDLIFFKLTLHCYDRCKSAFEKENTKFDKF